MARVVKLGARRKNFEMAKKKEKKKKKSRQSRVMERDSEYDHKKKMKVK